MMAEIIRINDVKIEQMWSIVHGEHWTHVE